MSDYLFFLSYAHADRRTDRHNCIVTFRKHLAEEVRRKTGSAEGSVCFFDGGEIRPGNIWREKLSEAISTCQVFVPIYSPTYFQQDYCGREWKIFSDRLKEYKEQNADAGVKNLIQPVLLEPPLRLRKHWTHAAASIQYTYERYPPDYETVGLHSMFKNGRYKNDYIEFTDELANRIVKAADECPLPPLDTPVAIEQTTSAFDEPNTQTHDRKGSSEETGGPRYVQFIFVAGKRGELQEIRNSLGYYGPRGGTDWRPFLPEVSKDVESLAGEIIDKDDFLYEIVPLDENIIQRLERAKQDNKVVAIIVDTWTLNLEWYCTRMLEYDKDNRDFLNCVVLVIWNRQCNETLSELDDLESAIGEAFPNLAGDPSRFLRSIDSLDELERKLRETLPKVCARISETREVEKKVEGQPRTKPTI